MMKALKALVFSLALLPFSALAGGEAWLTDLDEAKKIAAKENKSILIDFTGSDWCHWCVILKKEVFGKEEFVKVASKDFVLVELDFPRRAKQDSSVKEKNEALAKHYQIEGFPTVLLTDKDCKVFTRTGYQKGGVKPYLAHLKQALERKGLR